MIRLYNFDELKPEEILNRDIRAEKNVEDVVDAIIADVRARGDDALKDYALKFDGAEIENLQVTQAEIDEAFAGMDPYFLETLRQAAENIEQFHRQQVHKNFVMNDRPGIVLGQKYTPIEKAGVYVPGGTAAYPSTVLMDVIPAKVAGVSEIVMTTPAGKDGKVNPVILAAAATAGVTKIFKTGGAQAVAALAYGTQSIPAVDKIVGPGNIYVATAKRKVFGKVGIDMIAGPSEILVLADGGCNPAWVAADLLSQAEHDKLASPVLVTDSPELAQAVGEAMRALLGADRVKITNEWTTGCTDMGDVSCIMPVLHPHIAGAAGKSHGDDYHLVDREMACVNSAKGQLLLMALLMENGAARAKQVVERYHAPYESKAAYFATLDAILRDRELIEYHEDTAQIRL